MSERLRKALRDPVISKDVRVVGDFVRIFCDGNHRDRDRAPLSSAGVDEGCYKRPPVVCEECAGLMVYAEKRRALCPLDPKPFCSNCETHCYKPDLRRYMREVMRYAGPRSMLHGHAVEGVRHLIAGRRHKAVMRRAAKTEDPNLAKDDERE